MFLQGVWRSFSKRIQREQESGAATSDSVPFWFFCSDLLPDPERRYQNGHASLSQPQRWPLRARKHGMSPARLEIGMVQTSLLLQWRWGLASPRNHYKNVRSSRHWQPPEALTPLEWSVEWSPPSPPPRFAQTQPAALLSQPTSPQSPHNTAPVRSSH